MKADVHTATDLHPRREHAARTAAVEKLRSSYDDLAEAVARAETLDRAPTQEAPPQEAPPEPMVVPQRPNFWAQVIASLERWRLQAANRGFSSISRRIVLLNLAGLVALVSGILYLSEYRAGLV